tara:strand:- start:1781 stop:2827 length:1047 start_codon:yes stop_codon:yes gene_type:complete
MSNNSYLQNQSYKEFQKLINYIIGQNNTTPSQFNGLFLNTFNLNKYQQNITSGVSSVMSAFSARNYSMTSTGKMKFVNPNSKYIQNFYNFIESIYGNFNTWVGLKNYFLVIFCKKYSENSQNMSYLTQNLPTWDDINQSNILVINTFDKGVLSIVSDSNDQMSITNTIAQNAENISYQNLTIQKEIPSVVSNCSYIISNKSKRCRDYQYFYNGKWYVCRNQITGSKCGDKSSSTGFFTDPYSLKGRIESTQPPETVQSQYDPPPLAEAKYIPPSGQPQYLAPPSAPLYSNTIKKKAAMFGMKRRGGKSYKKNKNKNKNIGKKYKKSSKNKNKNASKKYKKTNKNKFKK